jgi:hypothetical protein
MSANLLLVGDLHLGRRPARLPEGLGEWSLGADELTPAAAWQAVVERAIRDGVDALILAGDVVEADNARFEAFGRLEDGVRRLVHAGVRVCAVAGNHDVEALPRLADLIPDFELLGRGGSWEQLTLEGRAGPAVHLLGWSFPVPRFSSSPLESATLPPAPEDGLPRIGVMHCEVDSRGPYAPVTRAELESAPVDGWFLGHVHAPSSLQEERPIGYLGSLIGLDPTETGPHGPWRLSIDGGRVEVEQIPLAPLRWEELSVSVDALTSAGELLPALDAAIRDLHAGMAPSHDGLKAVGCRVVLSGASKLHRELRSALRQGEPETLRRKLDDVLYFVDKIIDRSRPSLDLMRLAGEDHPPALLARRLLALEQGGDEAAELIGRARRELTRIVDEPYWAHLERTELDDDQVRRLLLEAGLEALEELLKQVESDTAGESAP